MYGCFIDLVTYRAGETSTCLTNLASFTLFMTALNKKWYFSLVIYQLETKKSSTSHQDGHALVDSLSEPSDENNLRVSEASLFKSIEQAFICCKMTQLISSVSRNW